MHANMHTYISYIYQQNTNHVQAQDPLFLAEAYFCLIRMLNQQKIHISLACICLSEYIHMDSHYCHYYM